MARGVRFEDVSKRYGSGTARYSTLRDDLTNLGRKTLGLLRHDRIAPRGITALDHVSFGVAEGEAFALIGPNGAGKSTALKLLARITYPTGGRIHLRGRVGGIIEVGTGIHPELTGRENIWLYGRIMGMSKPEIRRKFGAIVDFAELGPVLDTPVKMYSSGMQLRLGFSIASHIDPDIFIVDEALAVGDAGFQAKCVERMTTLVSEGRTLLFVSHNLAAVETICRRGIFLLDGKIMAAGSIRDVLRAYLNWIDERQLHKKALAEGVRGRGLVLERVTVHEASGAERYVFETNEPLEVRFQVVAEDDLVNPWFTLGISDGRPGALVLCSMLEQAEGFHLPRGRHVIRCRIGPLPLGPHTYEVWLGVREAVGSGELLDWSCVGALRIRLPGDVEGIGGVTVPWLWGPVRVKHQWMLQAEEPECVTQTQAE